jgi:hypothetical protein
VDCYNSGRVTDDLERQVGFLCTIYPDCRLPDATILGDAFKLHDIAEGQKLHYLLRKTEQPVCLTAVSSNSKANGFIYFMLDVEKSIFENLKGTKIIEFPTIYVFDEIPDNWTVEEMM